MTRGASERVRIERELGIALDDVDLAAVERAKLRGVPWHELVEEVLVHETWFFRDPGVFDALASFARQRGGPLRVLSAPCSTGEEAYSCAIALQEVGLARDACTIVGVDVSERALARARAARYGPSSFRSTRTGWEDHALSAPDERGTRLVTETLRERVQFRCANLVEPRALEDEAPFDVVLCRNLVVYLTPEARARLARTLARRLAPGGVLFLGHAEELAGFERWGPASGLAFRAASAVLRALPEPKAAATPPASALPVVPAQEPRALETARALADRGRLDEALAHAERAVREARDVRASARAYTLLGSIESARGRASEALRAWQRAVYLDPSDEVAVVSLATALRTSGELVRADALLDSLARARR